MHSSYFVIERTKNRISVGKDTVLEKIIVAGFRTHLDDINDPLNFMLDNRRTAYLIRQHGLPHNEKGPTIYTPEKDFFVFMVNGKIHRDGDLPALIDKKKDYREYWTNNKLSRCGGPAIEMGSIESGRYHFEYWIDGIQHRTAGPAVVSSSLNKKWYLAGKQVTEAQHILMVNEKLTQEVLDRAVEAIKTNKDVRIFKAALKRAGYSNHDAKRFETRFKLLKVLVR